jgi:hypothetical protein
MDAANRLRAAAADVAALRALTDAAAWQVPLRTWQAARLERTHADLLASPRYRPATRFFLEELYGSKDFSRRDAELTRVIPTLVKFLPESALTTIATAVELDALSERLDLAMTQSLDKDASVKAPVLDARAYARAYRVSGERRDRERQIELVDHVGHTLDALVSHPMIGTLLKAMHAPAQLAGLGAMQAFLVSGFSAFKAMRGADEFLALLVSRETAVLQRLYEGDDDPFDDGLSLGP